MQSARNSCKQSATPHTLRHSFACHTYEHSSAVAQIPRLPGHVKLGTPTIHAKVGVIG